MSLYQIKVKGTETLLEVESDNIPDELCNYIFQKGLESIMGRGRTNLAKKEDHASEKEFVAQAVAIAEKQREDLYAGKTRMVGGGGAKKAKGPEAAVQREMLRLAKVDGDEILKAQGFKVTKVSAASKKELAEHLIRQDSEKYRKAAEVNLLAAASAKEFKMDLSFVKEDEKKAAKAAKAKAERAAAKAAKDAAKAAGKVVPPPPTAPARGRAGATSALRRQ